MSHPLSTEEFLLASDNQLGDIWVRRFIEGAYPEAIEDWCGARKFFHDAYVGYRERQCLADQRFRVPFIIPPGSDSYRENVMNALGAGQVVLDSEWIFEGVRVRVPVLEKSSDGFIGAPHFTQVLNLGTTRSMLASMRSQLEPISGLYRI
jgi:hypothetical protein